MVEALVLLEPFLGFEFSIGIGEGLVYELKILGFALLTDELVGLLEHWLVIQTQAQPEPALFDLGVARQGKIEVSIDALEYLLGDELFVLAEFIQENELGCL